MADPAKSSSRLALTLEGYEQGFTFSQGIINGCLRYYYISADKELPRFNWSFSKHVYSIRGILGTSTVTMIDAPGADQSLYDINFQSDKYWWYEYPSRRNPQASPSDEFEPPNPVTLIVRQADIKGWSLVFCGDFSSGIGSTRRLSVALLLSQEACPWMTIS